MNLPILRHPDIQPNNIFVNDDFTISGLIDWQHSVVLPNFLAAGIPKSFQKFSDHESASFIPPKLPDDLDTLDEYERAEALEQFRQRHVHFFYLAITKQMNEPHLHAVQHNGGLPKRRIFTNAGNPWEGLNTPLQVDIAHVTREWTEIAAPNPDGTIPPCPVTLDDEEVQKRFQWRDSIQVMDDQLERIRDMLGIAIDGWMPHERFDISTERAKEFKEEGLEAVEDEPWLRDVSERHWPFDDFDEEE